MNVRVLASALKHGLTEEEILYACDNAIKWQTVEKSGNINGEIEFVLGTLPNGNLCELLTTFSYDEETVIVFHANTPPTKNFMKKLEERK